MTINQLLKQFELFPYSKEYYEFYKECHQLNLLNQFIENQNYYSNNDLYIEERFDKDEIDSIRKKINGSSSNIKEFIIEKINSIGKFFNTIFTKLLEKWNMLNKREARLQKVFQDKLTDEQIDEIEKVLFKEYNTLQSSIQGPIVIEKKKRKFTDERLSEKAEIALNLAIEVKQIILAHDEENKIIDINSVISLINDLYKPNANFKSILNKIKNKENKSTNSFIIDLHYERISDIAKQLQISIEKLKTNLQVNDNSVELSEVIKLLTEYSSKCARIYLSLNTFKMNTLTGLEKILIRKEDKE